MRLINYNKPTFNEMSFQEAKESPPYKAENSSSMVHSSRKHSERNNNQDRKGDTHYQNTARVIFKLNRIVSSCTHDAEKGLRCRVIASEVQMLLE